MKEYIKDFNNSIARQGEQWSALSVDIDETIEARREYMIRRQAGASAKAVVSVLNSPPCLYDEIVGALSSLCGNPTYNYSSPEDTLNDYVRDILGHSDSIQVRDQTRQGISGNSKSAESGKAGELDIQIRHNGIPIGIYEGLKLNAVDSKYIHEHIRKATIKYNPQGVKEIFVVAYVINQETAFGEFWERFKKCVRKYKMDDPIYAITWDDDEENTGLSAIRSIHGIYNMDNIVHNVYVMAVKLMQ